MIKGVPISGMISPLQSEANRYRDDPGYKVILSIENGMNPSVTLLAQKLNPGAVVCEIGVGEGRDAIPLADQDFIIHVQDFDSEKYPKLLENITEKNAERMISGKAPLNIRVDAPCDAKDYNMTQDYDAIISVRMLHFMERENALSVIGKIQKNTNVGGWNVINFFSDESPILEKLLMNPNRPALNPFFPSLAEIYELYKEWEVILERTEAKGDRFIEYGLLAKKGSNNS